MNYPKVASNFTRLQYCFFDSKMATVAVTLPHNHNTLATASSHSPNGTSSAQNEVRLAEKLQLSERIPKKVNNNIEILGHRGALFEGVENTLEAFQSCLELDGCHGVELDVFLLKDGNLVVFHGTGTDKSPGLLQDICHPPPTTAESILDLTLRQAQALRFLEEGSEHLVAPNQAVARQARIPTLREVLELFRNNRQRKRIKIELKGEGTPAAAARLVEEMNMTDQVVFSSFKFHRIQQIKQVNSRLKTGAIFTGALPCNFLQMAQSVGADEIHLRYDTCRIDRVVAAQQHGFHVMAWFRGPKAMRQDICTTYLDTRNEEDTYRMVLQSGVDAICCNRPHLAVRVVDELWEEPQ